MDFRADMMRDQPDDAFAVLRREPLAGLGQSLGQPVDPDLPVRVQHYLDDRRVLQEVRDRRAKRGAQHARTAPDGILFVLDGGHVVPVPPGYRIAIPGWG